MRMFKSIFSKYFTVISLIIVVSFIAMGGTQLLFSTRYWTQEKRMLLDQNAGSIASYTANNASVGADGDYYIQPLLIPLLQTIASGNDYHILVANMNGEVLFRSQDIAGADARIPDTVVAQMNGADYFSISDFGGYFVERQYTAGCPILKDGNLLGYAFVSMPAGNMSAYIADNFQIFILSALGVLTLTFIVLYAMTYRMVRPLRQMAAAARSFGSGDFSYRIPVKGRDEVAELAASLNNMAVSLSSVEGMRRSFVANVSHELKTPMTTIAGFIDGILDGTIPPDKHKYYLKIVSDEVKRLSRLVKSMLDLSRIDSGQMKINPVRFDLTEVTCSALLSFERRIEEKNMTVEGLEDCPRMEVNGDFDLLGQVVYNLLDNAVKFTNEGGTLSIHITRRDGRVYFTIRNSGIGIPANEMPHIFERFYKSDKSRSLDKNGVGLGLYIVKTVINLHHGEITVRSVEGEYCEFCFWLPDAPARS